MKSIFQNLGGVINMPQFKGRKLYMHKTRMDEIALPIEFSDFSEAIETVISKVSRKDNVCYITIDEKYINHGTHRRSGIHVDLNWYEELNKHSGGGGHRKNSLSTGGMLLVSNYAGCKVWKGDFAGKIKEGGDCSVINVQNLPSEIMPANEVYYLNALGIHESILINEEVYRTLIRINFHPLYKFN